MIKILFVCHGNICRSPTAEFVMKRMVQEAGASDSFEIASAATSNANLGQHVYPLASKMLNAHGIDCSEKVARRLVREDYDKYDLLIGMDNANIRDMKRICGGDSQGKIHRLMEFTDRDGEVADPWFTRDFNVAWNDIVEGCTGLLNALRVGNIKTKNTARA